MRAKSKNATKTIKSKQAPAKVAGTTPKKRTATSKRTAAPKRTGVPKRKRAQRNLAGRSASAKLANPWRWPRWATAVSWLFPVAALAVIISLKRTTTPPEYTLTLTSAKLASLSEQAREKSLGDRIAFWSEKLLNDPALLKPLGSGPKTDDVTPVFPNDYDCTTFVETVGALSRAHSIEDLAQEVLKIRYAGDVYAFDTRNHFPEADWIPNNSAKGVLKDITSEIATRAGLKPLIVSKTIDRGAWLAKQPDRPVNRSVAAEFSAKKEVKLPYVAYVPFEQIEKSVPNIPQGAIVNIVRSSRAKFPVLISHQGFIIWKDGVAYFRHASRNREIRDVPFAQYLRSIRNLPWRVIGINVNAYQG